MSVDNGWLKAMSELERAAQQGKWELFGPCKTAFSDPHYLILDSEAHPIHQKVFQTMGDMEGRIPQNLEQQKANCDFVIASRQFIPKALECIRELTEYLQCFCDEDWLAGESCNVCRLKEKWVLADL